MIFHVLTLQFYLRYLFSRRAGALIRTIAWICIVGIGLGVMSLVIVLSVMNGFNGTIRQRLLAVEPHLVISNSTSSHRSGTDTWQELDHLRSEFQQVTHVETALVENQDVILRTLDGNFGGAIAKGMDRETLERILLSIYRAGRKSEKKPSPSFFDFFNSLNHSRINGDSGGSGTREGNAVDSSVETEEAAIRAIAQLQPKEVILGVDLAHSLRVFEGDQIMVIPPESLLLPAGEVPKYENVTVKALFSSRVSDVDGKVMFYHLGDSLDQLKSSASKELNLELRFPDANDYRFYEGDLRQRGFTTANWIERNQSLFFALKMEKLAMTVFLALSAFITCFSIITVLVLLLTQKRRDLGIMMAMGLSQTKTRIIFTRVGMMLSLGGMLGGLGFGLAACFILERYPIELLPDIYYDSSIPVAVTKELIYLVLIVSFIVAFLSAYFPVRANTSRWPAHLLKVGRK